MMRNFIRLSFALLLAFSCGIAHADTPADGSYYAPDQASNANGFVPLAQYGGSPKLQAAFSSTNLGDYFNSLFTIFISIGGILAVIQIVRAGFIYAYSSDSLTDKQKGREMLADAVIGLLLLLSIYVILNQIDPHLLNLNVATTLKNVSASPSPTP